ncbi:MAG TPA: hypothetical protein VF533_05315 [Solirubrobacteraceae bacterium]
MRELLRPPAHRGPLIAAGAVVLVVGVLLAQLRVEDTVGDGVHLAYAALLSALLLALGWGARGEGGAPAAYQSVLLVCGLLLLAVALFRLADVLGAGDDGYPAGALVWTSAVFGTAALVPGLRLRSGICVFLAGLAGVSLVLNGWQWLFSPSSATPFRVLLVLMALAFVLVSLVLRGGRYRASVLLVDAAGLLMLALGLTFASGLFFGLGGIGGAGAGTGWELVLLASGCGLVAFGAVDRQPGPAWIGAGVLALFVLLAVETESGDNTLLWWPLVLLLIGGGAMAAGLRPRDPLPPEPDAYPARDRPLASRTGDGDETVIRVRVED